MVSIRVNQPRSLTVRYVGGSGEMTLLPGINLNVDPTEWQHAARHPIVKRWIEYRLLDVLTRDPETKGELEGFEVAEDRATDKPLPVQPARQPGPDSLKPTGATSLDGMNVDEARKLINATFDPDTLRAWSAAEKAGKDRKTIDEAIADQIREIEAA